jgi:hypothetical protein
VIRIVDNKKLEMTDDEYKLYQSICVSYDRQSFKGKELFVGLFESDDSGNILFLIPPSSRQTSLEVVIYLVNLMTQQQLRLANKKIDDFLLEVKGKVNKLIENTDTALKTKLER